MEELTKTQIVLLTLLVSFVTSIATGIVTVALVDQSSQGVSQTIQTVVEKTIDTVIPATKATSTDVIAVSNSAAVPAPPSESDLIVQAVAKNSPSIVRIKQINTFPAETFVALGVVVSNNGLIVTDKSLVANVNATYEAVFSDGAIVNINPTALNASTTSLGIFSPEASSSEKYNPVVLGDSSKLDLGQTVISISGNEKDTVNQGIVSSFDQNGDTHESFIKTDFDDSSMADGSILLNLNGEVIGIKTSSGDTNHEYLSSASLKAELNI